MRMVRFKRAGQLTTLYAIRCAYVLLWQARLDRLHRLLGPWTVIDFGTLFVASFMGLL